MWYSTKSVIRIILAILFAVGSSVFLSFGTSALVNDEVGNLSGDVSRRFVDIVQVEMSEKETHVYITIRVDGRFPFSYDLLGTGMQLQFQFFEGDVSDEDPAYRVLAELRTEGWGVSGFFASESSCEAEPKAIDFSSDRSSITLFLEKNTIASYQTLRIDASTENYPKWIPVTSNPPVLLKLTEPIHLLVR